MNRLNNPEWFKLRDACFERDDYHCRKCKKDCVCTNIAAHHIIPVIKGGKDELINLMSVCPRCHKQLDNQYLRLGLTHYMRKYITENKVKR